MIWRFIAACLKWTLALGVIAGVLFIAYKVNGEMRAERMREGAGDMVQSPRRTKAGVVELGVEQAERHGITEEPVRAVVWTEKVVVHGQVVPNPRATVEVRSPSAGILRVPAEVSWPAPGQWLRSGDSLGWVDARVAPLDRLNLRDNLDGARLRKEGAQKVVELERERVKRIQKVSESRIVPGQQLDDARVLLANAETQLAIATAAVTLWEGALADIGRQGGVETSTYRRPVSAPADGTVVELAARPGMEVEAGTLLLQLVDFRRLLARLDLPRAALGAGPPLRVRVTPISADSPSRGGVLDPQGPGEAESGLELFLVGPSPLVDDASQLVGYWYTADLDSNQATHDQRGSSHGWHDSHDGWRPGLRLKARLTPAGALTQRALAVPLGAVLFHQGRTLVYVRVKAGSYERREVKVLGREGDSWVVASPRDASDDIGPREGDAVVRAGGQILLSEEFRSDVETD